ncbi:MAG: filamentous hemagglutinin N-terminal domain-containing protein, partial [Candidatus Omnitrophica bacterium]|nr:filamentous hemagglutinin N-terminal domain-containing protein [Candidatus Omnitrophota bacterium]
METQMKPKLLFLTVLAFAMIGATIAFALPQDARVENGSVSIETSGSTMNITASDKAIINFSSFNIAQNETVNFIQPANNAACLSRVTGPDASVIAGTLSANGILFLINQNGVTFTPTANVNVNTLVVSTLDIASSNFINGNYELIRNQDSKYAKVLNQGTINANNIALIGSAVENSGIIIARAGTIHLASGDKTVVSFDSRGLINVAVTEETSGKVIDGDGNTIKDAILNSGTIEAHQVYMTAQTAKDIFENAVNNVGTIRATKVIDENGMIKIVANDNIMINGILELYGNMYIDTPARVSMGAAITAYGGSVFIGNSSPPSLVSLVGDSITKITAVSPKVEIYRPDSLYIENLTENGPYINIMGEGIDVNYLKTADLT